MRALTRTIPAMTPARFPTIARELETATGRGPESSALTHACIGFHCRNSIRKRLLIPDFSGACPAAPLGDTDLDSVCRSDGHESISLNPYRSAEFGATTANTDNQAREINYPAPR